MVECLLCKQKVAGSNPVVSTVTVVYGMAQQTVALLDRVRLPAVTPHLRNSVWIEYHATNVKAIGSNPIGGTLGRLAEWLLQRIANP